MRKLPVSLDDLRKALTATRQDTAYFLDLKTGEVLAILESQEDDLAEMEAHPHRYLSVPPEDPGDVCADMEEFAEGIEDSVLRGVLERALAGAQPFNDFREALSDREAEREAWKAMWLERGMVRAKAWLEAQGIEPAG
jgi:hypothetical protein